MYALVFVLCCVLIVLLYLYYKYLVYKTAAETCLAVRGNVQTNSSSSESSKSSSSVS